MSAMLAVIEAVGRLWIARGGRRTRPD